MKIVTRNDGKKEDNSWTAVVSIIESGMHYGKGNGYASCNGVGFGATEETAIASLRENLLKVTSFILNQPK